MVTAAWVEVRMTAGAVVSTHQILSYAQFPSAASAQYSWLVPLAFRPDLDRVIGQRVVTVFAGVVGSAALHPDCDDVFRLAVVGASRLRVEADSADIGIGMTMGHGYRVEDP